MQPEVWGFCLPGKADPGGKDLPLVTHPNPQGCSFTRDLAGHVFWRPWNLHPNHKDAPSHVLWLDTCVLEAPGPMPLEILRFCLPGQADSRG